MMRAAVELSKSYRLLNHSPVVLVASAANGRDNVMPAAWVMPVDFDPPLIAAVIATRTFTRELVDASSRLSEVKRNSSPARPRKGVRQQRVRTSAAAAKSNAMERERIRRMSPMDRALLALDLGERMNALAELRDERV